MRPLLDLGEGVTGSQLTRGYCATIDEADRHLIEGRRWSAMLIGTRPEQLLRVYAVTGLGATRIYLSVTRGQGP